ncbi:hypothetical protein GCM10022251_31820 [Phytohabitans flavus]|uniref:HTH cro/C1-type domain-containing protein n=2 Tax=Phytohabitans flavus TaxID=1076124 RepID=A0A6F8XWV3_9ACTN|nr:hypothetical protein Pflav_046280 [Phytohabitans flavus]
MSQEELAAATGVSVRTIQALESGGIRVPRAVTIRLLADAFRLSDEERDGFVRALLRGGATAVDGGSGGPAAAEGPAEVSARHLPRRPVGYVGRGDEERWLRRRIDEAVHTDQPFLAVVDGMAGVGKTALAVSVAHGVGDRFPDAHLFLDLQGHGAAPLSTIDAAAVLLRQLGVERGRIPDDPDDRLALWRAETARRRMLLVLDNAASTAQIEPLLPVDAAALTLVTSRTRLGLLAGAPTLSLMPLDVDDATDLLRQIVGDRIDREVAEAAVVSALCGSLPLAIRLVGQYLASRPLWTVRALVERLRGEVPATIDVAAEGQTVAATFTISYRQLADPTRRMLRLLGAHPSGGFELWTAAAIADLPVDRAQAVLDDLVESHLLWAETPGRYRMHDLVRDFARSLLSPDEAVAATGRLLSYFVATVRWVESTITTWYPRDHDQGPAVTARPFRDHAEGLGWLDDNSPSMAAAIEQACQLPALRRDAGRLGEALFGYHFRQGRHYSAKRLQLRTLEAARQAGDQHMIATTQRLLAGTLLVLGDRAESLRYLKLALRRHRALGDTWAQMRVHANLTSLYRNTGPLADAVESARTAIAAAVAIGDRDSEMSARLDLGHVYRLLGDPRAGIAEARVAVAWARGHSRLYLGRGIHHMALNRLALGHPRVAILLLTRALRLRQETRNPIAEVENRADLCLALAMGGDSAAALDQVRTAVSMMRTLGDLFTTAYAANRLGAALRLAGRPDEARPLHDDALAAATRASLPYERAQAHLALAALADPHATAVVEHRRQARELLVGYGAPVD